MPAIMRIHSLCPSNLYHSNLTARAPAGLPMCQLRSLAASPVSSTDVLGATFSQSWQAASMSSGTGFQPAAAAVVTQPAAAPARQLGFSSAPMVCYSPAEPALKEPLGDVLKRAGKRLDPAAPVAALHPAVGMDSCIC